MTDTSGRELVERSIGGYGVRPFTGDPGFQPPKDPLDKAAKSRIRLVYRDVPNLTVQSSWTIADARSALCEHMMGIFEGSGQLMDSVLGDPRVQATLGSRIGGLFGRAVRFKPANESAAAREVCDAWEVHWPAFIGQESLQRSAVYTVFMGFSHGQILWDTTGKHWLPYARPWHPRYSWYDWYTRHYIAISQDGVLPIFPGDGKWYGHLPFGVEEAWKRGAVRATAQPWMGRNCGTRDWFNYSEIHGMPMRKAYTPAAADPIERSLFEQAVAGIGSNTTMLIPRGVDKDLGYDVDLLEPSDGSWECFPGLIDRCDMDLVLAIKFQNLTTQITAGGSYAAAQAHGKGEVAQVAADNTAWRTTIQRDFARPFALVNFGDAALAPVTDWDVPEPAREDYAGNAIAFQQLATAVAAFAQAGFKFKNEKQFLAFARSQFGVTLPESFEIGDPPVAITAHASTITADANRKKAEEPPSAAGALP